MTHSKVYVIRNQADHYLSKQGEWVEGRERQSLFRSPHKDVAVNQLFELTLKDITLRGALVRCRVDARGEPLLEAGASDEEDYENGEENGAIQDEDAAAPEEENGSA